MYPTFIVKLDGVEYPFEYYAEMCFFTELIFRDYLPIDKCLELSTKLLAAYFDLSNTEIGDIVRVMDDGFAAYSYGEDNYYDIPSLDDLVKTITSKL